jgi:hypothetical protein
MKDNYEVRNRFLYKSFQHERGLRRTNRRAIRAFANIPSYLRRKKTNCSTQPSFFTRKNIEKKLWSQFFSSENLEVILGRL